MFTGLVLGKGRVLRCEENPAGLRLEVSAALAERHRVAVGDSVAVSGVCLTAEIADRDRLVFQLVPETLARTYLGRLEPGDEVNLELPLTPTDRLGGHFVQGHVDGVGRVRHVERAGEGHTVEIELDRGLVRYIAEKGSIAVDGVSLTVTRVSSDSFRVALIPHTLEVTTLGRVASGVEVHIEVDILAKYVGRLLSPRPSP